jgi:tripartite-type tricarboxylate transporter receptor subunit TctC
MKNIIFLILFLFSTGSIATTISVIVPFSVGGPTDQLWRFIKPSLNERLEKHGIKLITENLPGAGGTIAANKISSTDDRLILGFFSPALVIAPALTPEVVKYSKNSIKIIGYAGSTDMIVVSSLTRLQFEEKCKQGKILFGSSGNGSTSHLLGTIIANTINCKETIHVPYKGISSAYIDLIAGRIDYLVDFEINASSQISGGKVKKIFSVRDEFPNNLENWHILISNNYNNQLSTTIEQEIDQLKKDRKFVKELEERLKIRNFSLSKNQQWLDNEFRVYQEFINNIK